MKLNTFSNKGGGTPLIPEKREYNVLTKAEASTNDWSEEDFAEPTCWKNFKKSLLVFLGLQKVYYPRTIKIQNHQITVITPVNNLSANVIRNQKYNPFTFVFVVLYEQFKYFFNLYYLIVAMSQFIPPLQIGYLFTYITPLAFVLFITILKELYDDVKRWQRDREANSQIYRRLTTYGYESIPSSDIRVGDLIIVEKDMRVPADMILLKTTEKTGSCFIRTDQLDGETDWKLRRAVTNCQKLPTDESLLDLKGEFFSEKPKLDIYNFIGKFTFYSHNVIDQQHETVEPLSVENTIWMNTVVANGNAIGLVIYTGSDTRSSLNTSSPKTKVGLLDEELNNLSKLLFVLVMFLSFIMIALGGFKPTSYIDFFRFILLFSAIIPISLVVNLNMAKTLHSFWIMRDKEIPGSIARSTSIPEELGRISYLLSDKTGTLTQNDMAFKKLHLGMLSFSRDTMDDIQEQLRDSYNNTTEKESLIFSEKRLEYSTSSKVRTLVQALALCHNVTPNRDGETISYQASSPDEVALVKFSESVGMTLFNRSLHTITIQHPTGDYTEYDILNIFPFSSETKRMGIIVRDKDTNQILFYMKGADVVMANIVNSNDWLDEECGNMAREGLRTLVFGLRRFTTEEYEDFARRYQKAKSSIKPNREAKVQEVVESIERGLELIGLTGVEDKLQEHVRPTLEMLQNAGIKIWMLTGDKIETATCIAVSARLINRSQQIYQITVEANNFEAAYSKLMIFRNLKDAALIIDGKTLQLCLEKYKDFISTACKATSVVCCRCSPTQKAEIVKLIGEYTKKRTAAIGDGGNDVSMIQAANVGIGIVGKEGKQASLAADYSITQFHYIRRLIIWHGRNSYKRSASLGQFVIHRGLIISFIQSIFSALFYFAAIAIYNGWLLVGYSTIYTMAPVFSLVLDVDVTEEIAFQYPELYRELQKGRSLSYKTFFTWIFKSVYQGGTIMLISIILFEGSMYNIVSITFTTLILTELINVAFEIHTWHYLMLVSEILTLICYFLSMLVLPSYFDFSFILSWTFVWKVVVITAVTCLPIYLSKFIRRKFFPPAYTKLS